MAFPGDVRAVWQADKWFPAGCVPIFRGLVGLRSILARRGGLSLVQNGSGGTSRVCAAELHTRVRLCRAGGCLRLDRRLTLSGREGCGRPVMVATRGQ